MHQRVILCRSSGCLRSIARALPVLLAIGRGATGFEFTVENSCFQLNNNNTDLLNPSDDCFLPENLPWCNCTRTLIVNPVRGQATVFEQGVMWADGQDGVANHRIEVDGGTLNLSGIDVGEVIGGTLTDEIIPGVGQNFRVASEIRVTAKSGNQLDFDVVINEVSPFGLQVLTYNPLDANHSDGLLYRGRITANGPGAGMVIEYHYEKKEAATHAGIEVGDLTDPGFNVRLAITFFTRGGEGAFVLPGTPTIGVVSTLRKFKRSGGDTILDPAEILPLGAEDLCVILSKTSEQEPCRVFNEELALSTGGGSNNPPIADIVATDLAGGLLFDNMIAIDCGVGRVLLRGSNSSDGDNGTQGLTFNWEIVAGPKAGAAITADPTFMDTELSVYLPGDYTIRLVVNDGQSENNTDEQLVSITGNKGFGPNLPPDVTSLTYRPDGEGMPEVELIGGELRIELVLDAGSVRLVDLDADLNSGLDGCTQPLVGSWSLLSGPAAAVTFSDPLDDDTDVIFSETGEFVLRLEVDDRAPEDNITRLDITVVVRAPGVGPFLRGDCNGDGQVSGTVTDAVVMLNFNFLGAVEPACIVACDANGDGAFRGTVTDAVFVLNFNFLGGLRPPAPYPVCGTSANESDVSLGCATPQPRC